MCQMKSDPKAGRIPSFIPHFRIPSPRKGSFYPSSVQELVKAILRTNIVFFEAACAGPVMKVGPLSATDASSELVVGVVGATCVRNCQPCSGRAGNLGTPKH